MSYGENEERVVLLNSKNSANSIPSAPLPAYHDTFSSNNDNINNYSIYNHQNMGYQNNQRNIIYTKYKKSDFSTTGNLLL